MRQTLRIRRRHRRSRTDKDEQLNPFDTFDIVAAAAADDDDDEDDEEELDESSDEEKIAEERVSGGRFAGVPSPPTSASMKRAATRGVRGYAALDQERSVLGGVRERAVVAGEGDHHFHRATSRVGASMAANM